MTANRSISSAPEAVHHNAKGVQSLSGTNHNETVMRRGFKRSLSAYQPQRDRHDGDPLKPSRRSLGPTTTRRW